MTYNLIKLFADVHGLQVPAQTLVSLSDLNHKCLYHQSLPKPFGFLSVPEIRRGFSYLQAFEYSLLSAWNEVSFQVSLHDQ